ncbi:hypothetical protein IAE16_00735 [Hydrogenobacter sp. T-2]|uniref:hypothetical protein n=1 Tax=Pampinifervens diazotrophicum TaxID=1632018 RepID=UPI002B2605C7|nr:hypothetical protein [Hydrogenobacter sp. T-2]WPM32222.1 hypothetical protein IAE16_00735 [Hydrogenobacter sp. T-2]
MDLIGYSLKEQELEEISKKLQDFKNSLLLDLVVLMDDGGRLVSFAPFVDTYKSVAQRVALIGAAVVGAVDQLENIISSKRSMFFSGQEKNMYVHMLSHKFMLASVFNHKVPLGSVKLFKEKLSRELTTLLENALARGENRVVRFEDLAL